ncbi:MAG TPA: O-antigen polymerase [Gemmatimonadaceae bacterium]|nr:O-antigen polymerase [Gemmatimonadaceae bacterium]
MSGAGNEAILLGYIVVWLLAFMVYQARKRCFDAGSLLLMTYLLYAVLSLLLFRSEYYPFEPMRAFPFVYLFLLQLLAFYPVLRFDATRIDAIQRPSRFVLLPVCLVFIGASLSQVPGIVSGFTEIVIRLLTTPTGGQDLYNEAMAESYSLGDGSIANMPSIITNAYGNFGVLLLFYYVTLERRSRLITLGLLVSCLIGIVQNVALGQRGPIQEAIYAFVITYLAVRRWYSPRLNRRIQLVGLAIVALAAVPLVYLTASRFGESNDKALQSTYFYLGQQNLFFNNHGLDNNGIRYGDRTVPLFKRMLGFEGVPNNFHERRDKYPNLAINDEVFVGFAGDVVLDFGPWVAPVLFLAFTAVVLAGTRVRDGTIRFHQLLLLHFVMTVGMLGGIKLYPYSDVGGNLQLIVYLGAYALFVVDHDVMRRRARRLAAGVPAAPPLLAGTLS